MAPSERSGPGSGLDFPLTVAFHGPRVTPRAFSFWRPCLHLAFARDSPNAKQLAGYNKRMEIPSIQAVLFDFDGTLADSYQAITASVNQVRAGHGLPPLDESAVRPHVGRGMPYLLEHTVPGVDQERDQAIYRDHHPTVMLTGTRLL